MSVEGAQQPLPVRVRGAVRAVIWSAFLLRCGQSASSVIIGFYLALLARQGEPVVAIVAALLLSSSYAVELVMAPIMGALSDRWGRKPFIIAGPLIGLASIQIYPLSSALWVLFLARGLEGISAATLTPATLGFLADNTRSSADKASAGQRTRRGAAGLRAGARLVGRTSSGTHESRGRTMAYFEIATLVGIGAGYAFGGRLWQQLGSDAFRAAAVLYLASALVVWIWVSHTQQVRHVQQTRLAGYVAVVRQPRVLRFAPAWLCVTAVIGLWFNNLVFQLAGPKHPGQLLNGGLTGNEVSTVMGAFVLLLIAGTFGWSRLFGRFASKTTIMIAALCGIFVVCADLLVLNHRGDDSAWWLAGTLPILALAVAVGSGFTPAALAYLADITEDFQADRGVIMGLYSIILSIGEVVGGVAGGPFAQAWGLDGMIVLTLLLAAAAMATVILLRRGDTGGQKLAARQPLRSSPCPTT